MKELDTHGAGRLVMGIVKQAVYDWRSAKRRMRKKKDNKDAERIIADCETFFRSSYFGLLTNMDGEALLQRLMDDMENEERRYLYALGKEELHD